MNLPSSRASTDYYDVLNVPRDASLNMIKEAFHNAARLYHPDKTLLSSDVSNDNNDNNNDDAKKIHAEWLILRFQQAQQAWEYLRDPVRRKTYDESLRILENQQIARKACATSILTEECRTEIVEVEDDDDDEGADCGQNNGCHDKRTTTTTILIYTCRCGHDIEFLMDDLDEDDDSNEDGKDHLQQQQNQQQNHNHKRRKMSKCIVDCPGCSLTYDFTAAVVAVQS